MKWLYVFALSVALVASENPEGNGIFSCFLFNYGRKAQLVTIWSTKFSLSLAFEVNQFYDVQVELA